VFTGLAVLTVSMGSAGGLWVQAAFLGHWQMGGGCSLQLWSQVPALLLAGQTQDWHADIHQQEHALYSIWCIQR
jgi:hypothetical protein